MPAQVSWWRSLHFVSYPRGVYNLEIFFGYIKKGELLSLTWGQIDFKSGRINLRAIDTKAKQKRFFPMTNELREILERQRQETDKLERLKRIKVLYVFHRNGQQIIDFYSVWRTACNKAGYAGKLIHDFRRTAVRNFIRKGIPQKVAKLLSGHKTDSVLKGTTSSMSQTYWMQGKLLKRRRRKTATI